MRPNVSFEQLKSTPKFLLYRQNSSLFSQEHPVPNSTKMSWEDNLRYSTKVNLNELTFLVVYLYKKFFSEKKNLKKLIQNSSWKVVLFFEQFFWNFAHVILSFTRNFGRLILPKFASTSGFMAYFRFRFV